MTLIQKMILKHICMKQRLIFITEIANGKDIGDHTEGIGLGIGLVLSGNKPLPDVKLTQIH